MEENENVVEETTQEQPVEKVEESKFNSADDDSVFKVDLSKLPTEPSDEQDQVENDRTNESGVVGSDEATEPAPEQEEVQAESETQESPVLEEITDEEPNEALRELVDEVEEAVEEAEATGQPLPENIQKLVDFMNDTGGTLEDYVNLNRDYSGLDNLTLLREYYKQTKPHLDAEEIDFMMEDQFSYDEEMDEDRDIKRY